MENRVYTGSGKVPTEVLQKQHEDGIAYHVQRIISCMGDDPTREGLQGTPHRVAQAFAELLSSYHTDPPDLTTFEDSGYDVGQMVSLLNIPFTSLCEHHILPFSGVAHVGYIPQDRIVGISKLARVVDYYARFLQVQERLTAQVADYLEGGLRARGVIVVVEAAHTCMSMRGARTHGTSMVTTAIRGIYKEDPTAKSEFLGSIRRG